MGSSVVVFLNAVTIGIEIDLQLKGQSTTPLEILEHMFLAVYIVELALYIHAFGMQCFKGPGSAWFRFDALLVLTGLTTSWLIPIVNSFAESADSPAVKILQ